MIAALAATILALPGDHNLTLSGEWVPSPTGGGMTLRWAWAIDAYFGLTAAGSWYLAPQASGRGSVGVLYRFDDYEWVPWAALSPEAVGDAAGPAFALELTGGLDWRATPTWSVGLVGSWHPTLVGDVPDLSSLGLRVGAWW